MNNEACLGYALMALKLIHDGDKYSDGEIQEILGAMLYVMDTAGEKEAEDRYREGIWLIYD